MTDVGVPKNFVDTQDVSLTRQDAMAMNPVTYTQLTDVIFSIDSNVEKNQLTDDTIDNVFSLRMNSIEGDMVVTTSEWSALVVLTEDVNGIRPILPWIVKWIDATNTTKSTTFEGQLKTLTPIDSGLGSVMIHFRIEGTAKVTVT